MYNGDVAWVFCLFSEKGFLEMLVFVKSASMFGGMFAVTTVALTLEVGQFNVGVVVGAGVASAAKYVFAAAHHAFFAKYESKLSVA